MLKNKSLGISYFHSILTFSIIIILASFIITGISGYIQYTKQIETIIKTYQEDQDKIIIQEIDEVLSDITIKYNKGILLNIDNKQRLIDSVARLRYSNLSSVPGFFFIRSFKGISLMSSRTPHLSDIDISKTVNQEGINIHNLFMSAVEQGGGFVNYTWLNPNTNIYEEKRSYIQSIPEWDSYIGSGFWLSDIQTVIDTKKNEIIQNILVQIVALLIIGMFILVAAFIFSRRKKKELASNFKHFTYFFDSSVQSAAEINISELKYDELIEIAKSANIMSLKRTQAKSELKQSLNEKEILLKELYHRTKNNMQVINSFLNMKIPDLPDDKSKRIFEDIQKRIYAMAMVHEKLYKSKDLSSINLNEYINDLCILLLDSISTEKLKCNYTFDLDDVTVLIDIALPLALLLTELVSNAQKHANPDSGVLTIFISLKNMIDDNIIIKFQDNGVGLPDGYNIRDVKTMGLQTIFALGEDQLRGKVSFENNNGLLCTIKLKTSIYVERI